MTPEDWSKDMASLARYLEESEPSVVVNMVWRLKEEGLKLIETPQRPRAMVWLPDGERMTYYGEEGQEIATGLLKQLTKEIQHGA